MRVFLDANILFSAAKSDGAIRGLLAKLRTSQHALIADAYVVGEAQRNIEAKFPTALADFESLLAVTECLPRVYGDLPNEIAPELPQKDHPVLAAAIQHLRCCIAGTSVTCTAPRPCLANRLRKIRREPS